MENSEDRRHEQRTKEMKVYIPEEAQKRNFLLYYKQFINIGKRNIDKLAYSELINSLSEKLPKSIMSNNALIMYDAPISKEVFLVAFTKHENILPFRYMSLMDIQDFWEGNLHRDNINLDESELLYADKDLKEDVLCIFASKNMLKASFASDCLSTLMAERSEMRGRKLNKRITLVFFQGTEKDLIDQRYFGISSFFSSKTNGLKIDLNLSRMNFSVPKSLLYEEDTFSDSTEPSNDIISESKKEGSSKNNSISIPQEEGLGDLY